MMTCLGCGVRITSGGHRLLTEGLASRRSVSKAYRSYCTRCAIARHGNHGRANTAGQPDPRYCTCYGTIRRDPATRDQCADCKRRLQPCCDSEPGDIFEVTQ